MTDYWTDCISEAFEDAGIAATKEQVEIVASWAAGAHEHYGMSHGHDCIPNPLKQEVDSLSKALRVERSKITCPECCGSGAYVSYGPVHCARSRCSRCRGEGRVIP